MLSPTILCLLFGLVFLPLGTWFFWKGAKIQQKPKGDNIDNFLAIKLMFGGSALAFAGALLLYVASK